MNRREGVGRIEGNHKGDSQEGTTAPAGAWVVTILFLVCGLLVDLLIALNGTANCSEDVTTVCSRGQFGQTAAVATAVGAVAGIGSIWTGRKGQTAAAMPLGSLALVLLLGVLFKVIGG